MRIEESAEINRPPGEVFDYVADPEKRSPVPASKGLRPAVPEHRLWRGFPVSCPS